MENLVVLGKGLPWSGACSTETGNEEGRKQEPADFRAEPSRLWRVALISMTEGEALEVTMAKDLLLCMTRWQLDEVQTTAVSTNSYQDRRHLARYSSLENVEQRHWERTGDQLPQDMRLAILLSMCLTDLEKELNSRCWQ